MRRFVGLLVLNAGLIAVLSIASPKFLTRPNLTVILDNMGLELIALAGITMLLIGGYFDLSVDGVVALSGIVAGTAMSFHTNVVVSILLGIAVGMIVGLVNGIVVIKARINPLIATLTTWWICVGIAFGVTKAIAPYGFPQAFQDLGQARILGLRIVGLYAIIIIAVLSVILHWHQWGAWTYVSGDNREASYMLGVPVTSLGISLYVLVGSLAAVIGILLTARLNAASPMAVDGMTLRVIAAAVIGGCALSGGKGSILTGVLGLLLMSILGNAIIIMGVSPYWQKTLLGGVLLAAVLSERLNFNRRSVYHEVRRIWKGETVDRLDDRRSAGIGGLRVYPADTGPRADGPAE